MSVVDYKEDDTIEMEGQQELGLELRLKEEKETREIRLGFLKLETERLFPGEELKELKSDIDRSFSVPQFGEYHNEGMLMDTHLVKMLSIVDDLKAGVFAKEIPSYLGALMQQLVLDNEDEIKKYVFLHDISKADCLRLRFDSGEDKDITWQEWEEMVPEDVRNNPVALKDFCDSNGLKSISYFQEGKRHGETGAEKLSKYGDKLSIPDMIGLIISKHELAHHFSKVKSESYKNYFKGFSPEEEIWVILASYIDTMASFSKEQKPNLESFENMVDSIKNYHLAEIIERVFVDEPGISRKILDKKLGDLRKSSKPVDQDVHDLVDIFRIDCSIPIYDKNKLREKLQTLSVSSEWILDTEQVLALVDENGQIDGKSYGKMVSNLKPNQIKILRNLFESKDVKITSTKEKRGENRLPLEKIFDLDERRKFVSVERFNTKLETIELNREKKVELLFEAFSGHGTLEKLKLLDKKGILDELIPEFARNRNLTQDARFHGVETVGEHLLNSVALMEKKVHGLQQAFSGKGFERLLLIAAFFHDIGKNEDEEKSPVRAGKEGLGYRVVTKRGNEDFERVRFLGHQGEGEKIFIKTISDLESHLPEEQRLTSQEILMVSLWIKHHMRAVGVVRDLEKFSAEELAEQIVKDAYPVDLLNARIPLKDVIRAGMLMQESELLTAIDSKEKESWIQGWEKVKQAVELMLPILDAKNKRELMISLIKGEDLLELGIPKEKIISIVSEVEQKQLDGEIVDRRSALLEVVRLALEDGLDITEEKVDDLAGRGAFREMKARKENLKLISEESRDGYIVRKYETTPIQQFTQETSIEEMEAMIYSGNFPSLVAHLKKYEISTEDLKMVLLRGGFANLLQVEFFVKEFCTEGETILNVATTRSPLVRALEINRRMPDGNEASIVVNNGYQGVRDHTGAGLIHIGEQRMEALKMFYRKETETDEEMVKRFFEEAVINAGGAAELVIPSDYDPERYAILLAPILNSDSKQFSGVIVDKSGKKYKVITTLFQESPKQLRGDLKNMLRRLKEKSNFTSEQLEPYITQVNKLLSTVGEKELSLDQLERNQDQPKKSVKKEETKKEEQVVIPDVLKPLGRILKNKLRDVASIYPRLVATKSKPPAFEGIVNGILRKKLELTDEQIDAIIKVV